MQLQQRKKYRIITALVALCIFSSVMVVQAQSAPPLFQVIHLPRKAGYSKAKLNTELLSLKDKEAVKKLLRSKNFPQQTAIVIYINRPGIPSSYWNINTSSPDDKEDNRIILQSRDNATTKIFKLSEFKNILRDTVAVIDTLSLEVLIKDDDYPDDQYELVTSCGKTVKRKKIPFDNGRLVFTKDLIEECKGKSPSLSLFNSANNERSLAVLFTLNFLTQEQKEELLSLAEFAKKQEPEKEIKDIAWQVYSYALRHSGRLHFAQLVNWLQKNTAVLNGDHQ